MWQAVPIAEQIYGFQPEINKHDTWTATAYVEDKGERLQITTDIHMSYVDHKDEYEELLDSIRYFANVCKQDADKDHCVLHYRCMGTANFQDDHPLPFTQHTNGAWIIDTEFSEELGMV